MVGAVVWLFNSLNRSHKVAFLRLFELSCQLLFPSLAITNINPP